MNKKHLRVYLCAPLVLALGSPTASFAQDADRFEEITVTATKREESIYDVPIAMSAFDGDRLAAQGITDINDIGKFVPNMNVTAFSAGHVSSINPFIRGIGLQDHLILTDPGVSVYVDGVYLGRQVGQNWSLSNIDRVEVLRGPQGTLYGRNSIGGAVNIITKQPGTFDGARVGLEVGSRGRLNGDFYGDTELSENSAISFTGGYKSRDGLGKFVNLPNAGVEVGEFQEVFGRLAWRYATDSFSIVVAADANDLEGGLRPYTTLIDELPNGAVYQAGYRNSDVASSPYDNNTGQANQTHVGNSAEGLSVTAEWDFNENIAGKVIASTRHSEYKSGLDDDGFEDDFLSFPETGEADQDSVEFQLSGDFGGWDMVAGAYHFTEEGHNEQIDYTFNGGTGGYFLVDQKVTSQAIYANFGFDLSDSLRIAAGARYTEDDKDAFTICCINPRDNGSANFDELSWDLSANWDMGDSLSMYAAIQSGYQSGQFPARPYCLFGVPDCFQATDNITAINYELGIKGEVGDWLQMSAAIFNTEYSDLPYQVSTTSGGGFSTVNLVVDQTSRGFEWESTAYISDTFLLHVTLGYIDVDVERQQGVKPVAPLTPELTYSLSPELRFPLAGGASVTVRLDYSYRDEMWGEPSSDPGRMTQIEDRDILNANIAWRSADDSLSVALYGRNVSDERYTNAMINVGDYILQIMSNDASEFGLSIVKEF